MKIKVADLQEMIQEEVMKQLEANQKEASYNKEARSDFFEWVDDVREYLKRLAGRNSIDAWALFNYVDVCVPYIAYGKNMKALDFAKRVLQKYQREAV